MVGIITVAARAAERRGAIDDRRHHPARDQAVKPNASAGQDPGPNGVQASQRQKRHQQRDRQHHQRDLAGARDHPVIDLQHVERRGQIQQIDPEAEHRRGDKIAAAFAQKERNSSDLGLIATSERSQFK